MRVCRQWDYLQDLKWAGLETVERNPAEGDLALRCPACPREGVNFFLEDVNKDNWFDINSETGTLIDHPCL